MKFGTSTGDTCFAIYGEDHRCYLNIEGANHHKEKLLASIEKAYNAGFRDGEDVTKKNLREALGIK